MDAPVTMLYETIWKLLDPADQRLLDLLVLTTVPTDHAIAVPDLGMSTADLVPTRVGSSTRSTAKRLHALEAAKLIQHRGEFYHPGGVRWTPTLIGIAVVREAFARDRREAEAYRAALTTRLQESAT